MFIAVLFIVVILFNVYLFLKNPEELLNSILALLIFIACTIGLISIDYNRKTACKEVWSGKILSVEHKEEYDYWHEPWDEVITRTDDKGNTTTTTIHHDGYWEHFPAENHMTTSDDGVISLKQVPDGRKLDDYFVNSTEELEFYYPIGTPTSSIHIYENKVQASYSIFKHPEINLNEYPNLPQYPMEQKNYNIDRLVGYYNDYDNYNKLLSAINSELNDTDNSNNSDNKKSYKQVNIIIVNLGDVPYEYGLALQDYWQNGNKNDFVVCFGSKDNQVTWGYCFSWCEQEGLKLDIKHYLEKETNLDDFKPTIKTIGNMVEEQFSRKEFKDFDYIQIDISLWVKVILTIIAIIICVIRFFSHLDITTTNNRIYY